MINAKTVQFIGLLNELARKEAAGIESFENATLETFRDKIFYDPDTRVDVDSDDSYAEYQVVEMAGLTEGHHDAVTHYGDDEVDFTVRVCVYDDDGEARLEVRLFDEGYIYFADGAWTTEGLDACLPPI